MRVKVVGFWPPVIADFVQGGKEEEELLFALRVEDDSAYSDVILHGKFAVDWLATQGVAATAASVLAEDGVRGKIEAMLEALVTGGNASGSSSSSGSRGSDGDTDDRGATAVTSCSANNYNSQPIELYLRSYLSVEGVEVERNKGGKKNMKKKKRKVCRLQVFDGVFAPDDGGFCQGG